MACLKSYFSRPQIWYDTVSVRVLFLQAEDGIRDLTVTGVQTCALPILQLRQARCTAGQNVVQFSDQIATGIRDFLARALPVATSGSPGLTQLQADFVNGQRAEIGRASCRERG